MEPLPPPCRSEGRRFQTIVAIVCAALAINLTNPLITQLKDRYVFLSAMEEIKTYRLYRVLLQLHPEAEEELRNTLKAIATKPKEEQTAATQEASSAIVGKYFYPDAEGVR